MFESELFCYEFRDLNIPRERSSRQKVVCLSRHQLNPEEKYAIYFLHDKWVVVEHRSPAYADSETSDMLRYIKYFSEDGSFVYLIPPDTQLAFLRAESSRLPDFRFRQLRSYRDTYGNYRLINIIEHANNRGVFSSKVIIDSYRLSGLISRERVKFPLPTAPSPVVL
jgi:hypothetical protein